MAIIRPFRAIRPAPGLAADVAALPYDVMTSQEARNMIIGKPHSFLRVDRAEITLDESVNIYDERVYQRAKENLDTMRQSGVLMQDDIPGFYIYRLTMDGRAQTGLVVCTAIDEYLNNTIKKHERTREDKELDRIRHVDATNANTGPIFLTYRARAEIHAILEEYMQQQTPVYDFKAEDGVVHTVWVISAPDVLADLVAAFDAVPHLYIADGHHRNASAVKVGLKRRGQFPNAAPDAEFNYYLSVLFPDDRLHIMDYNRVVRDLNGHSKDSFLAAVQKRFDVKPAVKQSPAVPYTFGMYLDKQWYNLAAKPAFITDDPVDGLDVAILQNALLAPILGIADPRTDKRIDFVGGLRGLGELERRVDSGEMQIAFAMHPTSMAQLMAVADENRLMPPKSTWFEPKLRSGLFIHELE